MSNIEIIFLCIGIYASGCFAGFHMWRFLTIDTISKHIWDEYNWKLKEDRIMNLKASLGSWFLFLTALGIYIAVKVFKVKF